MLTKDKTTTKTNNEFTKVIGQSFKRYLYSSNKQLKHIFYSNLHPKYTIRRSQVNGNARTQM